MNRIDELVSTSREVPAHILTDVMGNQTSTRGEPRAILIVTYSGREGARVLKQWMQSTTRKLAADKPDVPLNFLSFADVRGVPKILRRAIRPVLVAAHNKSELQADAIYEGRKPRHHLIADWTGSHRELFGLEGEPAYHCLVIYQGRIIAAFDEPTEERSRQFVALIGELSEALN